MLRHPGYTGSLLAWVGYSASQGRLVAAYAWRIVSEERMLPARFGDSGAYSRHTCGSCR
jgi:protein-S-isoprenylcysteine O-methyltransferase Ste14